MKYAPTDSASINFRRDFCVIIQMWVYHDYHSYTTKMRCEWLNISKPSMRMLSQKGNNNRATSRCGVEFQSIIIHELRQIQFETFLVWQNVLSYHYLSFELNPSNDKSILVTYCLHSAYNRELLSQMKLGTWHACVCVCVWAYIFGSNTSVVSLSADFMCAKYPNS